jgi:AcrR family transcriptional regulator
MWKCCVITLDNQLDILANRPISLALRGFAYEEPTSLPRTKVSEGPKKMVANPIPSRRTSEDWSPNQLAKRDAIIRATSKLMSREGVRACTSRAISATSELSTSALHYYFRDTSEILDLAFRHITERFFDKLSRAAAAEAKPLDALWATATAYLQSGSEWHEDDPRLNERTAQAPMLWFEFQAESLRTGDLTTVRELSARGLALFETLVKAAGIASPMRAAQVLYSTLLGASIRDSLFHRPVHEVLAEISVALSLPPSAKYCRAPRAKKNSSTH